METSPVNVQPTPKSSTVRRRQPVLQIYEAKEGYRTFLRVQSWDHEGKKTELLLTSDGDKMNESVLEQTETIEAQYTIKPAYLTDLLTYTAKWSSNEFSAMLDRIPWIVRKWYMINLDYEAGWTGYGPTPDFIAEPKKWQRLPTFMKKRFHYPTMLNTLKTVRNNMWRVNCINVLGEDPATDWS